MIINRKSFGLGAILIIATLIIILAVFALERFSNQLVKNGDQFIIYGEYPKALNAYQTAQKLWPFLGNKNSFKFRLKYAEDHKDNASMVVFLKSAATQAQADVLVAKIRSFKGVSSVKYVSKQEALNKYLEQVKEPVLRSLVNADILPASIEIYLDTVKQREAIENTAKSDPIVDLVIVTKLDPKSFDSLQYLDEK